MKRALAALTMVVFVAALLTLVFAPRPAAAADDERMARMMKMMEQMNGQMKQMQEQMKNRPPEEQQKRMMQIYKEHNVSPAAGCMPMLLQAVVLIPVFTMIRMYEYQFSKGYCLWIGSSLSHRWPAWFGSNLASFDFPLLVIYIGTFIVSSLLQPPAADENARRSLHLLRRTRRQEPARPHRA